MRDGTEPPASVYPRLERGELRDWHQKASGFPALPGVRYPEVIQQPPVLDFGPDFAAQGRITVEPPRLLGHHPVRVPKSDADGNDVGTLLPLEVAVPLATYTGWNLRRRDVGAEAMLAAMSGSYLPFPRTEAERQAAGDPRESVEKRYGSFAEHRRRREEKAADLLRQRYLLKEDAERLAAGLERVRGSFPK